MPVEPRVQKVIDQYRRFVILCRAIKLLEAAKPSLAWKDLSEAEKLSWLDEAENELYGEK